jgi:hypothetical protein
MMIGKDPRPIKSQSSVVFKSTTSSNAIERYTRVRDPAEFYSFFREDNNFVSHQLFNFRAMKKHGVRNVSANRLNNMPSNLMKKQNIQVKPM